MTHSDQTMIKRLTGSWVRIGRNPDFGPIYLLSAYDASQQMFTSRSEHRPTDSHAVTAAAVLQAKRDGILYLLR